MGICNCITSNRPGFRNLVTEIKFPNATHKCKGAHTLQPMPVFNWSCAELLMHLARPAPHATRDPSCRMATKEVLVDWICCTSFSWSCTPLLSPPHDSSPHVTTDPSPRMAAKAQSFAWICLTLFNCSFRPVQSPSDLEALEKHIWCVVNFFVF